MSSNKWGSPARFQVWKARQWARIQAYEETLAWCTDTRGGLCPACRRSSRQEVKFNPRLGVTRRRCLDCGYIGNL